jgi:TolB-like protein
MVEEIITALSRFSGLLVIARNSSFAYKPGLGTAWPELVNASSREPVRVPVGRGKQGDTRVAPTPSLRP